MTPERALLLATAIVNARWVVIPGADHGSNLDNSAAFNREVLTFLETTEGLRATQHSLA